MWEIKKNVIVLVRELELKLNFTKIRTKVLWFRVFETCHLVTLILIPQTVTFQVHYSMYFVRTKNVNQTPLPQKLIQLETLFES